MWLMVLENSNDGRQRIPNDLYETIKHQLYNSFMGDFNLIIEEFDFYQQLSPKLQNQLIQHVFGRFICNFDYVFKNCEQ